MGRTRGANPYKGPQKWSNSSASTNLPPVASSSSPVGEGKAFHLEGPGGGLLVNVLPLDMGPKFESEPKLSTRNPWEPQDTPHDTQGTLGSTVSLEVTLRPMAFIRSTDGLLILQVLW